VRSSLLFHYVLGLTEDKTGFGEEGDGHRLGYRQAGPISEAAFLSGEDETTGRPWIKAFATRDAAVANVRRRGNVLAPGALRKRNCPTVAGSASERVIPRMHPSHRGRRRAYVGLLLPLRTSVAARTGKNIEVREKDRPDKTTIAVKTLDGRVASLEPATASRGSASGPNPTAPGHRPDASPGLLHQRRQSQEMGGAESYETGRLISISQALADKMKLSPEQIQKACKIGECSPK